MSTALTGALGILGTIIAVASDSGSLLAFVAYLVYIPMVAVPIKLMLQGTFTPKLVLALTAFYYGWFGLDLLFGGREQRLLLGIALGVFLVFPVLLAVLGWAGGAWSGIAVLYVLVIPFVAMGYWQFARFFEILWMDDEGFKRLLRGSYGTQTPVRVT